MIRFLMVSLLAVLLCAAAPLPESYTVRAASIFGMIPSCAVHDASGQVYMRFMGVGIVTYETNAPFTRNLNKRSKVVVTKVFNPDATEENPDGTLNFMQVESIESDGKSYGCLPWNLGYTFKAYVAEYSNVTVPLSKVITGTMPMVIVDPEQP